jgi:hypothetical protein
MSDQDNFDQMLKAALLDQLLMEILFSPIMIIELSGRNPFGRPPHVHECEPCQFEWEHDTRALGNDPVAYENAHKCPRCGNPVHKVKRYLTEDGDARA